MGIDYRALNMSTVAAIDTTDFDAVDSGVPDIMTPESVVIYGGPPEMGEAEVRWTHGADESVLVYCSHDQYKQGHKLEREEKGDFVGYLRLPVGSHLIRFSVDGDWRVDDTLDIAIQDGEEFNTLSVKSLDEDEEDDEEDDEGHGTAPSSPTRKPAAGGNVPDASLGAPQVPMSPDSSAAQKKKRKKRKKRKAANSASKKNVPDIEAIREEVIKREQEWREAWILHEIRNQNIRQAEKAALKAQFKAKRDQWVAKLKSSEEENQKLRQDLLQLQSKLERAESEKHLAQGSLSRQQQQFEGEKAALQEQLESLNSKLKRTEEEQAGARFRGQLDETNKQWESKISEWRQKEKELTKALEDARAELASKQWMSLVSSQKLGKEKDKLQEDITSLQKDLEETKMALQLEKTKSAQTEQQFLESRDTLVKSYDDTSKSLRAKIAELESELHQAARSLATEKNEVARLRSSLELAESNHKSISAQLNEAREKLVTGLTEATSLSEQRTSEMENEIGRLTSGLRVTEEKVQMKEKDLEQLQKRLSDAQSELDVLRGLPQQLANVKAELATLTDARHADLQKAQDEERRLTGEINKEKEAAARLTVQLEKSQEASTKLQQEISERSSTVEQLQSEFKALKDENAKVVRELNAVNQQLGDLEANKEVMSQRLAQADAQLAEAERKLNEQISVLESKYASVNQALLTARSEINNLTGELEAERERGRLLKDEFTRDKFELERRMTHAKKEKDAIVEKIKPLAEESKALRNMLTATRTNQANEFTAFSATWKEFTSQVTSTLNTASRMVNEANTKYKKELSERRKLYNTIQELKGNIRVFCRVRPVLEHESKKGGIGTSAVEGDDHMVSIVKADKTTQFEFDHVFGAGAKQEDVFADTKFLIQSVMDGYNVCIFAYGQTGSGKTFTMEGNESNPGVNYRALAELFRIAAERKQDYDYTFNVSILEIYNETIRDLLSTDNEDLHLGSSSASKKYAIRKGKNGIYVEGLAEVPVISPEDVHEAMRRGQKNRSTGVTNMNAHSSRSHCLVSIKVVGFNRVAGITYYGKLHLIDLAGSERLSKSLATGDRLKEAQAINKSLSALGNVIESLHKKTSHVPYRNSKLTFLLQDSLGGNAKTLMFINVSPSKDDAEETMCSLLFATRARKVELGSAGRNVNFQPMSNDGTEENAALDDEDNESVAGDEPTSPKKLDSPSSLSTSAAPVGPPSAPSTPSVAKRASVVSAPASRVASKPSTLAKPATSSTMVKRASVSSARPTK